MCAAHSHLYEGSERCHLGLQFVSLGAPVSCFQLMGCQLAAGLLKAGLHRKTAQECCTRLELRTCELRAFVHSHTYSTEMLGQCNISEALASHCQCRRKVRL